MLEIERKFLVKASTGWPVPFTDAHLVQVYLTPKDPRVTSERVRVSIPTDGGPTVFTHTKKVFVTAGVYEEDERVISKRAYTMLRKRADPKMATITKMRRTFDWAGRTFELDTFTVCFAGLCVMEVELPSMDTEVELPPFIEIDREVTLERDMTNAALARKGSWP